ncbi:hypothetical protein [Micromonospora sp. NPDC050200]|uniref:DUF6414 family protein n=1 Tax=Micromonospora sp. NPDC050200 TaxID=3155664 RepID=UPI0033C1CFBA
MLREFLYVDTQKVRSLLAQLGDGGVSEEVKITEKTQNKLSIGARNIANRDWDSGSESSTTRSLADAVFPALEDAMETSGYLVDLSDELQRPEFWKDDLQEAYPEGSFVRITAPARLFDSRYVNRIFAGLSFAANGFTALNPTPGSEASKRNKGRPTTTPKAKAASPRESPEDDIEDFPAALFGDALTGEQLRGFAKMTRGLFHTGLHLIMNPADQEGLSVSVRLEEGRSFLESEADVLFARYGVQEQEWTMVGTIGSHSAPEIDEDSSTPFDVRPGGIDRAALTGMISTLVGGVASFGFADLPQYPGFSIVPFAVYRTILRSVQEPPTDGAVV